MSRRKKGTGRSLPVAVNWPIWWTQALPCVQTNAAMSAKVLPSAARFRPEGKFTKGNKQNRRRMNAELK